jgi:hypothetical protein
MPLDTGIKLLHLSGIRMFFLSFQSFWLAAYCSPSETSKWCVLLRYNNTAVSSLSYRCLTLSLLKPINNQRE